MIDLKSKSAAEGLLPVVVGGLSLEEVPHRELYSVAPFKGADVSPELKKAVGVKLPEAGKVSAIDGVEIVWTARGQYFLIGAKPPKLNAAITDQSDAWCAVSLMGAGVADVMARLCPVDVNAMSEGDVVRSLIGEMSAIIVQRAGGFEIMVFRAFTKTLVHEMHATMVSVNAQM
ncbi:MAG: sarcosine oxidase subunit gamma [Litoreibacter sp.]|uniref:sarcosine oxidase subunit gamma n=1 Tax=Litoreibacter sp. TaxID=1969459 RepID=UPI003297CB18